MAGDATAGKRARLAEVLGSGHEVLATVVVVGWSSPRCPHRTYGLAYCTARKMTAFFLERSNVVSLDESRCVRVEVLEELPVELVLAIWGVRMSPAREGAEAEGIRTRVVLIMPGSTKQTPMLGSTVHSTVC